MNVGIELKHTGAPSVPAGSLPAAAVMHGNSEMAARIRAFDWSVTPLGPIANRPHTLVDIVNVALACPLPVQILWGPEFVLLYNDLLIPTLSNRHPRALGACASDLWEDAWPTVSVQNEHVFRTGEPLSFTRTMVPIYRNDVLEDAWWDYSYSAIKAPDGNILGVLEIFRDITETVLMEEARRLADQRLALAMEGAELGMWTYDPNTAVVTADDRMHRIFGSPEASGPVPYWLQMLHPEDRDRVARHFEEAVEGRHAYDIEYRILRGDEVRWMRCKGRLLAGSGEVERLVSIIEDITDRKRTEEALRKSERGLRRTQEAVLRSQEQLQTIVGALPTMVAYIDHDLRYVWANRAFLQLVKKTSAECIGNTVERVLGAESAAALLPRTTAALAGETQTYALEAIFAGELRHLDVMEIPDVDHHGRVRGSILEAHDVTEQKKAEKALLQNEKLAAVGRLAASIAHEINNPLEAVTNLVYLARSVTEDTALHVYLDAADRELRRVSAICNQTLRFYRQSTRPRLVTCEELVETVLSVYQGRLMNSNVIVERDRCLHEPFECFDGEIRQVLNNLVGNAIDAMQPGGGRLILRSHRGTHWPTGRRGVVLSVADTGAGMSSGVLGNLFHPFFTTKGIGGTGLGLWISKDIVDRHAGAIRLRSSRRPGASGTVFQVFLPAQATPQ